MHVHILNMNYDSLWIGMNAIEINEFDSDYQTEGSRASLHRLKSMHVLPWLDSMV
jgi:hypothetical protein